MCPTCKLANSASQVLLVYKAKGSGSTGMVQGVAFAEHWTGPYRRLTPDAPIVLPGDCEDPGICKTFRNLARFFCC